MIETHEEPIANFGIVSETVVKSELETPQSTEPPLVEPKESKLPTMSESQSSSSVCPPKPKIGKGRGELMKNLKLMKPPESQPAVMVGRLPMNIDQFDDSMDSIYYDTVSTPISDSTRRESTSSIEFQTPTISRNHSSSSLEIITPKKNPEIQTISLITPPNEPSILSDAVRKDQIPTIDLTTPPSQSPVISLITPSPHGRDSLDETGSDISKSSSSSKRGRGRGDLLASLSLRSDDTQSMKSATSYESLNEKLSQLKLETPPAQRPRGRGAMLSRLFQDSANQTKQTPTESTSGSVESVKSCKIDFSNDIVPLKSAPAAKAEKEIVVEQNELDLSDPFGNDILSEDVDYHDKLITKIMVLGDEGVCRFQPRFGINDFDLHNDVKKVRISV